MSTNPIPNAGSPLTRSAQVYGPARQPGDGPASAGISEVSGQGPVDSGPGGRAVASHKLNENWKSLASGDSYKMAFGKEPYVKDLKDENLRGILSDLPDDAVPGLKEKAKAGTLSDKDIKSLQSFLDGKGYDIGPAGVDGKYGPDTHRALDRFLNGQPPDKKQGGADTPANKKPTAQGGRPTNQSIVGADSHSGNSYLA